MSSDSTSRPLHTVNADPLEKTRDICNQTNTARASIRAGDVELVPTFGDSLASSNGEDDDEPLILNVESDDVISIQTATDKSRTVRLQSRLKIFLGLLPQTGWGVYPVLAR